METHGPKPITYPEGLDETKMDGMIQAILDGIDRDRLYSEERLHRVRHPLLHERMGKDVAVNTEIHNLLTDLATALSVSERISNRDQLRANIPVIEDILVKAAKEPGSLEPHLAALKDAVTQLAALNPDDTGTTAPDVVSASLRQKLEMPNMLQELIVYPPVTVSTLGESRNDALATLENCRRDLSAALAKFDDGENLVAGVETEAAAVRAWFEQNAA